MSMKSFIFNVCSSVSSATGSLSQLNGKSLSRSSYVHMNHIVLQNCTSVSHSLWTSPSKHPYCGWCERTWGFMAVAGQSAYFWTSFLWRLPHQQWMGADSSSLFTWVRFTWIHKSTCFVLIVRCTFLFSHLSLTVFSVSASSLHVYLGRRTQQGVNANEISRNVTTIIVHPSYDRTTNNNDIALLRLSATVTFNDYIKPVCLAAQNSIFSSGTNSWITGWGDVQSGGTNSC